MQPDRAFGNGDTLRNAPPRAAFEPLVVEPIAETGGKPFHSNMPRMIHWWWLGFKARKCGQCELNDNSVVWVRNTSDMAPILAKCDSTARCESAEIQTLSSGYEQMVQQLYPSCDAAGDQQQERVKLEKRSHASSGETNECADMGPLISFTIAALYVLFAKCWRSRWRFHG